MDSSIYTVEDKKFMRRALDIAQKGLGRTDPNPVVGAVIVKNGKIISEGYHKKAGGLHAEIEAIQKCPDPVKGLTLYVTLEPCTVYGKTPPCADEIIRSICEKT